MAGILERERAAARPVTAWQARHDEAVRVADEQLRFWRAEGVSVTDIFRELNGPDTAGRLYFDHLSRDDLLCLIATRWLAVAL